MATVDKETAISWFEAWADSNGLDFDLTLMDEEDKTSFEKQKSKVIKGIEAGDITFTENNEIVLTPANPNSKYDKPITFRELTGAALVTMDQKKKGQDVAKTYAAMGTMCGVPAATFSGLAGVDIKRAQAIFVLLMD